MQGRITYSKLKSMSATEISKLDQPEAAAMLRQFREKLNYRERAFKRAGSNVYSPALEKMQDYYDRNGVQSPESMNVNKLRSELFHIQEFFNSKTADVKGAREVMREQDARIFGISAKGVPLKRMTREERDRYWATYDEFLRTYKNAEAIYGSDKIQQYLGEMTLEGRKQGGFRKGSIGLIKQLNTLSAKLRENRGESIELRNVRSGR
jgi:hypothetical protein